MTFAPNSRGSVSVWCAVCSTLN